MNRFFFLSLSFFLRMTALFSHSFLTVDVTGRNSKNMGKSRERGDKLLWFYTSNYSPLTPIWWLFVFLLTQTLQVWLVYINEHIADDLIMRHSPSCSFTRISRVLPIVFCCAEWVWKINKHIHSGWRLWPANSSTVFNPTVCVCESQRWKETCFSHTVHKYCRRWQRHIKGQGCGFLELTSWQSRFKMARPVGVRKPHGAGHKHLTK